jgi:hypothetical protein
LTVEFTLSEGAKSRGITRIAKEGNTICIIMNEEFLRFAIYETDFDKTIKRLDKNTKIKLSLLTRSELDWLLGNNVIVSKSYQYKMKSSIRRKLQTFFNLELPLLQKSGIISDDLTLFGKDLTTIGKVDNSINPANLQIQTQNMMGRKGFEPSNPAMSRRYLNQARPPARPVTQDKR